MNFAKFARRFLLPSIGVTIYSHFRFRATISPRAEVELSPQLHIGRHTRISSFSKVKAATGPLRIGARCSIATGCFLGAGKAGLSIGDDCRIGANCVIVSSTYGYEALDVPFAEQPHKSLGTVIGNNVSIGSNSVVVDGARIGDNVRIGTQSLVAGRIPDNSLAAGNPAKVISTRS